MARRIRAPRRSSRPSSASSLGTNHPGALHLYIHAVEASREPGRAEAAADRLRPLMPGAGHLVHMPAHIYWRVGRYGDAVTVNVAAADADRAYFKTATPSPIYRGLYYPHNIDFIWQSAAMQGRSAETLRAARELAATAPAEMIKAMPDMETAPVAPIVALVRFGRWDEVLAHPAPPRAWTDTTGAWYFPVRHALGAVLVQAGRGAAAEQVYREDLVRNPGNGWALFGITQALRVQGKTFEAAPAEVRFRKAWAKADVTLTASRF